jgi:RNA-directed DNA polymerase
MTEADADKKVGRPERALRVGGGTVEGKGRAHQTDTARKGRAGDGAEVLMEKVCARSNLIAAYKRVLRNKGAPGVDGMTVDELMS